MQKNKTYFEQVPLDAIKKLIEEDSRRQSKVETPANSKAEAIEEDFLPAAANCHAGGRS